MADPAIVVVLKGQWTKVATNVTTGNVWRRESLVSYFMTIRDTGGSAPTAPDLEIEGVQVFTKGDNMPISSNVSIDVYLWARGDVDGKVRVDL